MKMTRKDYIAFAKMLASKRPEKFAGDFKQTPGRPCVYAWTSEFFQWRNTVEETADLFARDNARFSRSRFYAACGLREDEL
jgi:hypothetical protein